MGANMIESTNKVRRSISCYSLPALGVNNPDEELVNPEVEQRREMYDALRARKEALEDALQQKLAEVKALCLREAEITGVLPADTPRRPNEALPTIRRRIRTEFTLNDKLLTNPQSEEDELLSRLELEFEIQSKIVAASMKLMNEVHSKKSIRKQRKLNYEQAKAKLDHLEKQLLPIRQKLEESRKSKIVKKQLIEEINHKPCPVFVQDKPPLPNDHEVSAKRKRSKKESSASNSVPSSPVISREFRTTPLSPEEISKAFMSPAKRCLMKNQAQRNQMMMDSVHACDEVDFGPKGVPSNGVHSHDNLSLQSENEVPVFAVPGTPPSILKNSKSAKSPKKGVTINDHVEEVNLRSRSTTPNTIDHCNGNSLENVLRTRKFSADLTDGELRRNDLLDVGVLARTNSLENTRRKSYVSAVNSPPTTPAYHNRQYYNNHPLKSLHQKPLPKNPPPPVPHPLRMAQRPLPPTPNSVQSMSVPNVPDALEEEERKLQFEHCPPKPCRLQQVQTNEDISSKGVRSSVIRTPVGIRVSTSSSGVQSNGSTSSLAPSPSPSPVPSTASAKSHRARAISGPPRTSIDETLPDIVPPPVHKVSKSISEEGTMPPPSSLPPKSFKKQVPKPSPITIPEPSVIDDELVDRFLPIELPATPSFIPAQSRPEVETPRPVAIPMSPTVTVPGADVVSVGHYTPYWEETKPYELSDFYKYSAKHRNRQQSAAKITNDDAATASKDRDQGAASSAIRDHLGNNQSAHPQHSHNLSKATGENSTAQGTSSSNLMNESFITKAAVAGDFHDEMLDWYDENLKKATVV